MLLSTTQPLFPWDALDDSPTLATIKQVLATIPDQPLLDSLRRHRGHGRNDCALHVLWGVLLLTILLRHANVAACLAELKRNDDLRVLIGLPRDDESTVPEAWNVSHFLDVLGQPPHLEHLRGVFDHLIHNLGVSVPDLGVHTAGDAAALNARRTRNTPDAANPTATAADPSSGAAAPPPQVGTARIALPLADTAANQPPTSPPERGAPAGLSPTTAAAPSTTVDNTTATSSPAAAQATDADADKITYDRHGLPLAAGGRKEYRDDQGRVTKVVEWFGYKFHLLVDVKYEVSLAYQVSSTKAGDNEVLPALVDEARANLPQGRIQTLAYDLAADDGEVHEFLHERGIEPVILQRALWKQDPERLLPGHDGTSNIVYDEAGTVYCYDKVSEPPVRHRMAYIGHEPERGTLKYRCPAKHEDWTCPMAEICNAGKSYGKTVRIKPEEDLRRFPPIPRATKQFERLYKGRTAVERVNGRVKIYWGADDGNLVGATRFHAFLGTVMVVHAALATVLASLPRREGTLGTLKLSPIAQALQEQRAAQAVAVPV